MDFLEQSSPFHHRRQGLEEPFQDKGKTFVLRQWLNVIFILATIAGIALWYMDKESHQLASYILIAGVLIKFIEVTLRLMKL